MNKFNKKRLVAHGYWERKYLNGKARCKFTLNNIRPLGYGEMYHENGKIGYKLINI